MLGSGKVDFSLIRTACRETLSKMLDEIPGNKAIIWEKELDGTFSLVGDFTYLCRRGVTQMFYLSGGNICAPSSPNTHIIFVTKPHTASMDMVNKYLRGLSAQGPTSTTRQLHLWLVPRTTLLCERRLVEHGDMDSFTAVKDLPLLLFKMEPDLASMELPNAFRDWSVHGDPGCVHLAARALMLLQGLYGLIPIVRGKGPTVQSLYNMMVELRKEMAHQEPQVPSKIDQLIIIDRSVDLITPLTTQLTYEGLIDQCYGIKNCSVKVPVSKLQAGAVEGDEAVGLVQAREAPLKAVLLSSSDQLYQDIRDANFSAVGPKLAAQAKQITKEYEERHQAKTIVEMKQFVQKLPRIQASKQSLALHTSLAEALQEEVAVGLFGPALQLEQELLRGSVDCDKPCAFIEECIGRRAPILMVLRLLCFQSVINNGLKPKLLEYYKRDFIQSYGYHHLLTLDNLRKAGLLVPQQQKSNYATIRKTLRLIVDDVNELNPTDISYVHSGYAPISVRLARFVHSPGWRAITELLNLLPGPTLSETQHVARHRRQDRVPADDSEAGSVVLVFFMGGCTYSEVAALRFLSSKSQDNGGPEYVVATTAMLNSSTFLQSLSSDLLPQQS